MWATRFEGAVGLGDVLGGVGAICADGDVVGAKCFGDVVDVVEKGDDVTVATEESRHVGDAHGATCVEHGADDVVGFAADVFVKGAGSGVTDHNGLFGGLGGFKAGLPTGVGQVDEDAEVVHFLNGGITKIA